MSRDIFLKVFDENHRVNHRFGNWECKRRCSQMVWRETEIVKRDRTEERGDDDDGHYRDERSD